MSTPEKKIKLGRILKRVFDIIASAILLVILSPLILVISLAILLVMGPPILFSQKRLGHQGEVFWIHKFRTMTEKRDEEGNLLPDEKRLTALGKFLRSTTMDEIPELFNVLKGEMSAVGPRPLLVKYRERYTEEQWRRHEMPPGMAGPVLSEGRNELSWEEKFERDLWYVDNWSFWLDMKILFKTALQVVKREGVSQPGHVTMEEFKGKESGHD